MNWVKEDSTTYRGKCGKVEVRAKFYYDSGWYTTICYDGHLMWYSYYTKLSSAKRGVRRGIMGIIRDLGNAAYPAN